MSIFRVPQNLLNDLLPGNKKDLIEVDLETRDPVVETSGSTSICSTRQMVRLSPGWGVGAGGLDDELAMDFLSGSAAQRRKVSRAWRRYRISSAGSPSK